MTSGTAAREAGCNEAGAPYPSSLFDDQRALRKIWPGFTHPFLSLLQSRAIRRSQCGFSFSFEVHTHGIAGLYRPAYELPPVRRVAFPVLVNELLSDVMRRCCVLETQHYNGCQRYGTHSHRTPPSPTVPALCPAVQENMLTLRREPTPPLSLRKRERDTIRHVDLFA